MSDDNWGMSSLCWSVRSTTYLNSMVNVVVEHCDDLPRLRTGEDLRKPCCFCCCCCCRKEMQRVHIYSWWNIDVCCMERYVAGNNAEATHGISSSMAPYTEIVLSILARTSVLLSAAYTENSMVIDIFSSTRCCALCDRFAGRWAFSFLSSGAPEEKNDLHCSTCGSSVGRQAVRIARAR